MSKFAEQSVQSLGHKFNKKMWLQGIGKTESRHWGFPPNSNQFSTFRTTIGNLEIVSQIFVGNTKITIYAT